MSAVSQRKPIASVLISFVSLISVAFSAPVSKEMAKNVGLNWIWKHQVMRAAPEKRPEILSKRPIFKIYEQIELQRQGIIVGHLLRIGPKGFVLIAPDDLMTPILAYSFENDFPTEDLPPALEYWLAEIKDYLEYLATQPNINANPKVATQWQDLKQDIATFDASISSESAVSPLATWQVGPLLTIEWNQDDPYNRFCPGLSGIEKDFQGEGSSYLTKGKPWTTGGDDNILWEIVGTFDKVAKSGPISHNQVTWLVASIDVAEAGDIRFKRKVSSEAGYDKLNFKVLGIILDSWSGEVDWGWSPYYHLEEGHTWIAWEYVKDGSVSTGGDCAWIDEIQFPKLRTKVGCVAVAMGQIMKFHNYPPKGYSLHSYDWPRGGLCPVALFGDTSYDWLNMPGSIDSSSSRKEIDAVSEILYHCGVAVDTDYNLWASSVSGIGLSPLRRIANALRNYFHYDADEPIAKSDYDGEAWLSMMKEEVDRGRPVYYGFSNALLNADDHAVVLDGYDSDNLVYFNFGWGGQGDGFYQIYPVENVNVGDDKWNWKHCAITGISPNIISPPNPDLFWDDFVDFKDFTTLTSHWLEENCLPPSWCSKTDLDKNSWVDWSDMRLLADNWLGRRWVSLRIRSQGSYSYDPAIGVWTVIGDGEDIWGQKDSFHYVYRDMQGDGQIVARVVDITSNNLNEWAKAGVMIRQNLDPGSPHAMMVMTPTPGHSAAFQWRTTSDGDSSSFHGGTMTLPYWVNIDRRGNTFRAYVSPDGFSWTQWGTDQVIPMGTNVLIGLAVTSHNQGDDLGCTCAAKFSNVMCTAPGTWRSQDVRSPWLARFGSASYDADNNTWIISNTDSDIWGNSDGFQYVYKYFLRGDGQITARVLGITGQNVNGWAKTGVMIRESTATGSKHAMTVITPGNGAAFQWRSMTNGHSNHQGYFPRVTPNTWVRLVRNGSTFSGYYSSNGTDWILQGSATIDMANDIYMGLNVCSHANGLLSTAKFDNVRLSQGSFVGAMDIGNVGAAGSVQVSSGVYTIKGNGWDIWENSDAFFYDYARLSGNGEIIARVTSIEPSDAWTKVGVMMRETFSSDSKHAMIVVTPQYRAFQWRSTTGDVSYSVHEIYNTYLPSPPYWVRIERTGNVFRSYVSTNGTSWALVGNQTIIMNNNVYIGLCLTSHAVTRMATAWIDNVTLSGNIE